MSTSFLHPCLRRMFSDRGGNFGITTAIMAPVLLGVVGMALDYSNAMLSKRQLQEATDAGALAAATALANGTASTTADAEMIARNFVSGQMANYVGSDALNSIKVGTSVTVNVSTTATSKSYKVAIDTSYPVATTPFLSVLGYKTLNIGASTSTSSGTSDTKTALSMELVLDQSGSMGENTTTCATYNGKNCKTYVTKIDALKKAANALFAALDTADPDHSLVRTGAYSYNNGLIYKDAQKTQIKSMSGMSWGTATTATYVSGITANGGTDATEPMRQATLSVTKALDGSDVETQAHAAKGNNNVSRYIILMTDGEMTGNTGVWQQSFDQNVRDQCDATKTAGIKIFTVAFMAPDKGKQLLQYCASPGGNYYEAETMEKLVASFTSIAKEATKALTLLTN
ncbi:vWA domain-containing protein [Rhizobium redzepovicii]|uniref:vWA domain-containing protein n=1 Tax=Rhizobium redzepovicii TaxID=2867518 RepID=UPI001C933AB9|nr:TadE/TadG family type IV pilus assembly protein [Rhizobium redzepovicii]MBY4615041.1 TadE/TadG family protein [Rhizobium redzepovicii]